MEPECWRRRKDQGRQASFRGEREHPAELANKQGDKSGDRGTLNTKKERGGNLRRQVLRGALSLGRATTPLQSPAARLWQGPGRSTRRRVVLDRRIPALQDF